MQGFDSEFHDLPDYILKITERIWEGRQVNKIRSYYTESCRVETPASLTNSVETVVQSTLETLVMFPDRELLGEDVIWSEDATGDFYSSHRILSPMTHLGDGFFGPATGRKVHVRTIADCAVRNNQIYDEWLVRDQAAIVRQLGLNLSDFANALAAAEAATGRPPLHLASITHRPAYDGVHVNDDVPAQDYADLYRGLFRQAKLGDITQSYDRACSVAIPGGESCHGWKEVTAFWNGLLASLRDVKFTIAHLILREDDGQPARLAMRWCVTATHGGSGRYGAATGKPLHLLGISHAELRSGKILREWVLLDELAIWKQIHFPI
jgi:predicted ester cyclase